MSFPYSNRTDRKLSDVGWKNWLFVGSRMAGERAGILTSLVASCKNNLVEPWAHLRDLFGRMAYQQPTGDQLEALLPDRWLTRNPDNLIDPKDGRQLLKPKKPY